jgi:hypothetical protein
LQKEDLIEEEKMRPADQSLFSSSINKPIANRASSQIKTSLMKTVDPKKASQMQKT